MEAPGFVRGFVRAGLWVTEHLAFIAPLATRITIGLGFLHTGWGKLHNFDRTVEYFSTLGIPMPAVNAGVVGTLELVGGAFLIVGLLTRLFAFALSASMTVALMTADRASFLASWGNASETSPTDVASFVFLLFLVWLVLLGPGALSLDRVVFGKLASKLKGAAPAP
ncbi:MAG TPA: DoxX family protein [Thermoanaerobaculaceae bacterium]|nr:DoxX family protein [Thermoanaerobaculaceae bacterium]